MSELPFLAGEQGRGSFLVLLFFVSAAAVTGWGIWEGTLPHSEEAVYAEMARETASGGPAWTLHFDGEPVHDVPPLPIWSTALCIRLFGTNEFAAHIGFVLFAVLAYWIVYLAGMRTEMWGSGGAGAMHSGSAIGLLAAIILASSPLFAKYAPHLSLNVPFAFFVAIALLGWWYLPVRRAGLAFWAIGVVGGILSAGAAGALVVPASLVSLVSDRARRGTWRDAGFLVVTAVALILGGIWPVRAAMHAEGAFHTSPLWGAIFGFTDPSGRVAIDLLHALKDLFIGSFPWSIPAVIAVVRTVFVRNSRHRYGFTAADDSLVVFSAVLLVPIVFSRPANPSAYLPLLPLASILSAREIARWVIPSNRAPASARSDDAREFTASRIWSSNQILVALFCLLMLLLAATPLRLHRVSTDPIKEIATMAGSLVPEGERLGNYLQNGRVQTARLLFYGGRPLGPALADPEGVAAQIRKEPGTVFFATAGDLNALEESGAVSAGLRVLYRAGDLVLFDMRGLSGVEEGE
ncbi:MAG TPA: glycosyltransferase family 39 protein [Patescibacteria group bacterium]|nr:glycosyltransferase family 39 protein [Patescibacteria group bacterium]